MLSSATRRFHSSSVISAPVSVDSSTAAVLSAQTTKESKLLHACVSVGAYFNDQKKNEVTSLQRFNSPVQVMAVQTQLPHAHTQRLHSTWVSAPSSYVSSSKAHSAGRITKYKFYIKIYKNSPSEICNYKCKKSAKCVYVCVCVLECGGAPGFSALH